MTIDESSVPRKPAAPTRQRRWRNLLLIVAGFVALLGLVAGTAFIYFYDRATAIDRSTPESVVIQFLDASLRQKDPTRVSLFLCDQWPVDTAMAAAAGPDDAGVIPSWGAINVAISGSDATVTARVRFTYSDSRRQVQTWTFSLRDQKGWRVCGLARAESLEP